MQPCGRWATDGSTPETNPTESRPGRSSGPRAWRRHRSVARLGVPVDGAGRVLVESDLSVPGHPEVFVVGDLAAFLHQTGAPLPGVAPVAIQQARHAADTIRRALASRPSQPFRYRSLGNLATVGRGSAIADFGWLTLSGTVAWLAWLFVYIWNLIGFRNRIVVMTQWAVVVSHLPAQRALDYQAG